MVRIFALETDKDRLKQTFLVSGEQELGTCECHFLSFVLPLLFYVFLSIPLALLLWGSAELGFEEFPLYDVVIVAWLLFCLYGVVKHFVEWQYNLIIITTEKIVVVHHNSFFYRDIDPLPLDNIISARVDSQFLGMFRCGILELHLKWREDIAEKVMSFSYRKHPEVYAGIIQAAIAHDKHVTSGSEESGKS